MHSTIKIAIVLVQVGSQLWVNPAQVAKVFPCAETDGKEIVCIQTVGGPTWNDRTDWPLDKVLKILKQTDTNGGK